MTSLLRRSVAAAKVRPSHALLLTTQSYHANIVHNSYRRFSALNNVTLHENPLVCHNIYYMFSYYDFIFN